MFSDRFLLFIPFLKFEKSHADTREQSILELYPFDHKKYSPSKKNRKSPSFSIIKKIIFWLWEKIYHGKKSRLNKFEHDWNDISVDCMAFTVLEQRIVSTKSTQWCRWQCDVLVIVLGCSTRWRENLSTKTHDCHQISNEHYRCHQNVKI